MLFLTVKSALNLNALATLPVEKKPFKIKQTIEAAVFVFLF